MNQIIETQRNAKSPYEKMSPFEFKDKLISLAIDHKRGTRALLDAGRGNPNWLSATPREAFFVLGQFAVQESRRVWDDGALGGQPHRKGIVQRWQTYVANHKHEPGAALLNSIVEYGIMTCGFDAEEWIYELVDGIMGDNYPMPSRMLVHTERVVHDFMVQEMCGNGVTCGKFHLFAVEGATAAMCYIFDSLLENHLLSRGDTIAVMVPIFVPYVEIPHLHRYQFNVVDIQASETDAKGNRNWQYPSSEIAKLADPSIKALFLVNPSNPPSVAMQPASVQQLIQIVKHQNPNLMIISDDVYGTFVDDYRSLMADLPFNTVGVYSFSKYFGVTGWRLGVIAIHEHNIFDKLLTQLPDEKKIILHRRYASISPNPETIRFIDRMAADSRQVALNHTAGLSTPQQIQMTLLAGFALLDKEHTYKELTKSICRRRMKLLYEGLGLALPNLPHGADYYTDFDLEEWANRHYGSAFTEYLKATYEPIDVLMHLAENSTIVLLSGRGFHGPKWSIRVSLANLDDEAYTHIGRELRKVLEQLVAEWSQITRQP